MKQIIDKLEQENNLTPQEFRILLENLTDENRAYLYERARKVCQDTYGNKVFIRGLIEFSNYCKNNCYYCGIRRGNLEVARYRLDLETILSCCERGYELGFRTFVLQGGEDPYYKDKDFEILIKNMKLKYPDCAVTLSLGERSFESYQRLFDAGADRYLLRHETADEAHYRKLHPKEMSWENRMDCLQNLKKIGYQVGCGIMVGSPGQTTDSILKDLAFMKELNPHMVGIGPFLSHHQTPFASMENGSLEKTLDLLGIIRLMLPKVLLPATTALGTIRPGGRELGILAGANVVMPNLSPPITREKYSLYDNKLATGEEAAEGCKKLKKKMKEIGYEIVVSRGDYHV